MKNKSIDVAGLVAELRDWAATAPQARHAGIVFTRAANALEDLAQERDKAKADADFSAESWVKEIEANNALRERLKVMAAARAEG